MTHDILQTDIELAKEMIGSNRPADEVARALARRGIDLPAATQLVDDLRNGRPVRPQLTPPEFVSAARSSQRRTSTSQDQTEQARPQSPGSRPSTDRPSRRRSRGASKASPVVWFVAGIFGCILLTGAALVFKHWQRGRADSQELTQPKDVSPTLQANARSLASSAQLSTRTQNPSTRGIAMEVRTDGLYLGEAQLTKGKAWANIAKVLGSPTRTNQFMKGPRQVFAYDQHGILLYGESPEETESIVVDFEGSGGTNGTSQPFLGSLQLVGHSINNDTDSASVMRQLKLNKPKPDSLVFSAEYDGTDVIFSYDNPKKLSIVEIVLK